eukprot:15352328-Ditylum_brightwellii.AAC.1
MEQTNQTNYQKTLVPQTNTETQNNLDIKIRTMPSLILTRRMRHPAPRTVVGCIAGHGEDNTSMRHWWYMKLSGSNDHREDQTQHTTNNSTY